MRYIFLCICCLYFTLSYSQTGERYTTEQIQSQDAYLSAQVDIFMGRYELAIPKLLKIHKQDLRNETISFELAKAYDKTEDFPNAEKYAGIAAREGKDNVWIQVYYAKLLVKLEKYDEAAEQFEKLKLLDSEDVSHVENQAKALINAGKENDALKIINTWETANYVRENLVKLKYDIYRNKKDEKKARKELEKLVDLDPYNVRYLNNLAAFYMSQNKPDSAKPLYDRILEIDPNNQKANTAIYTMAASDNKDAPYLRSLLPLVERQDIDPDRKIIELIPFVQQLANNPTPELQSSLLQLTETLVLIHPDVAKCHSIRGDVLNLSNNPTKAIESYKKTLEYDKKVFDVWDQLFMLLAQTENYKDLTNWSYVAMDYFPNKAENYFYYGYAQNALGNADEAIDLLQEGLMISANNITVKSNILSELGRGYLLKKDNAQAEKYVDQALSMSQNMNPYALEIKGDLLALKGNQTQAEDYWTKAKKLGSKRSSLDKKLN